MQRRLHPRSAIPSSPSVRREAPALDDAAQWRGDRRGPPPAPRLGHVRWKPPRVHRRVCVARRADQRGVCVARVWRAEQRSGVRRRACVRQRASPRLLLAGAPCGAPRGHHRLCAWACRPAWRVQTSVRVPTSAADPVCRGACAEAGQPPPAPSLGPRAVLSPCALACVCVRGRGRGRGRGRVACPPAPRKRRAATRVRRAEAGNPPPAPHGQRAVLPVGTGACVCVCVGVQTSVRVRRRSCSALVQHALVQHARSCSARRRASACGGMPRAGRKAHRSSSIATLFSHSFPTPDARADATTKPLRDEREKETGALTRRTRALHARARRTRALSPHALGTRSADGRVHFGRVAPAVASSLLLPSAGGAAHAGARHEGQSVCVGARAHVGRACLGVWREGAREGREREGARGRERGRERAREGRERRREDEGCSGGWQERRAERVALGVCAWRWRAASACAWGALARLRWEGVGRRCRRGARTRRAAGCQRRCPPWVPRRAGGPRRRSLARLHTGPHGVFSVCTSV
jgi:hypothetical protein